MKTYSYCALSALLALSLPVFAAADMGSALYQWMTTLQGEWMLAPAAEQEGKATRHKLVKPLLGTDQVAISFRTVGRGSTVQETLLPGNKKEMVTMYHCLDPGCEEVKATHYCAKQNQPEMRVDLGSDGDTVVFDCDMSTELCQSKRDHIHRIAHQLSPDGAKLTTTYTSFKDGSKTKDSIYHFVRK